MWHWTWPVVVGLDILDSDRSATVTPGLRLPAHPGRVILTARHSAKTAHRLARSEVISFGARVHPLPDRWSGVQATLSRLAAWAAGLPAFGRAVRRSLPSARSLISETRHS